MRARAHIEELRGGRSAIIVTELPYGVKKGGDAGVIKKIADLVQDKVLTEIADLADHSDRTGMRIQVELKREAIPQVVLNKLFKHTALQSTFGYNAVALVGGVPKTLSLPEILNHYLDYQREIVTRRSKYELQESRGAGPHPRGLPDRARQPGRGHLAHPGLRRRGRGPRGSHGAVRADRDPGPGDSRPAPRPPHGARAKADPGGVRRSAGADRGASRGPLRRGAGSTRSSGRSCSRSRRSTRRRTTGEPRSWPPRRSSSWRT